MISPTVACHIFLLSSLARGLWHGGYNRSGCIRGIALGRTCQHPIYFIDDATNNYFFLVGLLFVICRLHFWTVDCLQQQTKNPALPLGRKYCRAAFPNNAAGSLFHHNKCRYSLLCWALSASLSCIAAIMHAPLAGKADCCCVYVRCIQEFIGVLHLSGSQSARSFCLTGRYPQGNCVYTYIRTYIMKRNTRIILYVHTSKIKTDNENKSPGTPVHNGQSIRMLIYT